MNLCGLNINCHKVEELLNFGDMPKIVVTVNAEAVVRAQSDVVLRDIINSNTATIDGQIPLWLYHHSYPNIEIEKISGSDLIYSLPEYAEKNELKVFLLGGQEESNNGAVRRLKELFPTLQIDGYSPPYAPYPFKSEVNKIILDKIARLSPDILFVGFGMGKQEYWAEDNLNSLTKMNIKLVVGCGGSFEFASGKIKRAPKFIQKSGMEGLWRLLKEFKWFRFKRLLLSSKILYYYFLKY